jgi:WD40 repeat protein
MDLLTSEVVWGPGTALRERRRSRARRLRPAVLLGAVIMAVLTGAPVAAAYDPLAAEGYLTTLGGPFATGTPTSAVAYSPDGTLVAAASPVDDQVRLSRVSPDGGMSLYGLYTYATGHGPAAVAFSSDGRLLAVANATDGTVSMFFVSNDQYNLGLTPAGAAQQVRGKPVSLAFSPNGQYLATGNGSDETASLYSVSDGGVLTSAAAALSFGPTVGDVRTVRFSSRNVLVVGVDFPDATYYFYQLGANGHLTRTGSITDSNGTLCDGAFSPDGNMFAYSNCYLEYDYVRIVKITADGVPSTDLGKLEFYPTQVAALAWSSDGSLLATGNAEGSLYLDRPPPPHPIPGNSVSVFSVTANSVKAVGDATPSVAAPVAMAFSRDGTLAVAGPNGTAVYRVSRLGRLIPVGGQTTNPAGRFGHMAFSADGTRLVTATNVFRVSAEGDLTPAAGGSSAGAGSSGAAFSPSGDLLARVNSTTGEVTLAAVSAVGDVTPIGSPQVVGHPGTVVFNAGGTLLAVLDATGVSTFRVSAATGLELAAHQSWSGATPRDVAFRPDGTALMIAEGQSRLATIRVDPSGAMSAAQLTPLTGFSPQTVAFNADGTLLAATNDPFLQLFAVAADGQPTALGPQTDLSASDAVFSPTLDATLVVARFQGIAVYATDEAGRLRPLAMPSGVGRPNGLAISPNGKLAAGEDGDLIGVWSLAAPWLEPRITAGPAALTLSAAADITFSANYPTGFECQIDGGGYRPCFSPWTLADLDDGSHVASVRGRDLSGTVQGEPVTWQWKSDVHGPRAPEQTGPEAGAANLPPSGQKFSWKPTTDATSAVDRYELWIDQGKVAEIAGTACAATCDAVVTAPLAGGLHSWAVRAYDTLGHMTQTAARSFIIDATPPSAPGLAEPGDGAFLSDGRSRLSWAASQDAGAGLAAYDVLVDGRSVATGLAATETGWTPPTALPEGAHTWQVVARDRVGNANGSVLRTLTVDQTSPVAALRVSPGRFVPPFKVTLDASDSTDPGGGIARYEFDLDGDGSYETGSSSPRAETTLTTLGDHALGVRVVDRVGRSATAADTVVGEAVTGRDSHEASVTINDGAEFTRSRTVALTIQAPPRSGAVTMIVSNDGQPDQTLRRSVAKRVGDWSLAKGDGLRDRRIVYVVFYNSAGLQVSNGRVQDDILYDPHAPTVKDAVLRVTSARAARLSFHARDRGSGLARWELTSGRRVLARRTHFKGVHKVTLPRRVGKVRLVLRDKAGNTTRAAVEVRRR